MNKKNTKKFIKRITNNYIAILPCKFTNVTFDNGEFPMVSSGKPLGLGEKIIIKQFIRGKITGYVKSLKRIKINKYKRKLRGFRCWEMLVGVESINRDDCLDFSKQ